MNTDDTAEQQLLVDLLSIVVSKGGYLQDYLDQDDEDAMAITIEKAQARTKQEIRAAVIAEVRAGVPEKKNPPLSKGEFVYASGKGHGFNEALDAVNALLTKLSKEGK